MGWKPRHLHPRSMAASSLVAEQSSLIRGAAFCRIFQVDSILQRFELVATVESSPRREQVMVSTGVQEADTGHCGIRPSLPGAGSLPPWPRVR
ncbi:hypothetical protein BJX65DRAFT_207021 [Aspergillus insuetus]